MSCTAYGLIGSDGAIGKIYEKTISATSEEFVLDFNQSEDFTGAVLYAVGLEKSTISYTYGSFTIKSNE
jgi:hypothetical protein